MIHGRYQAERVKVFYIGMEITWIALMLVLYWSFGFGVTKWIIWLVLIHFYLIFLRNIASSGSLDRGISRLLSLKSLFLLGAYLVFLFPYQLYVLNLLDIEQSLFLRSFTYSNYSNPALLLSGLLIGCFSMGWEIASNRAWSVTKSSVSRQSLEIDNALSSILLVGFLLLIPGYLFSGLRSTAEQRYQGEVVQEVLAEALYFTITLFCMISFSLCIYQKMRVKKFTIKIKLIFLVSLLWQFRLLLVGDRNSFFLLAIIQFVGYGHYIRRPNMPTLAALSFASIYLYFVIENFRAEKVKDLNTFISLGTQNDWSILGETSLNITTISLRASLSMIDESDQLFFGLFKVIGLLGVIPFSRGLLLPDSVRVTDTSQLITEYIFGQSPHWQVGTSLIADSFIDFGVVGVIVISFIYGFIGAFMQDRAMHAQSFSNVCTYLLLLAFYFQLPRYSADFPVRSIAWTWLVILFAQLLSNSSRVKSRNLDGFR